MSRNPKFDASFVLLCATRYAIGRQTFAPKIIADYIAAHPDVLTAGHRSELVQDIHAAMDQYMSPISEIDHPTWERVLAMLEGSDE